MKASLTTSSPEWIADCAANGEDEPAQATCPLTGDLYEETKEVGRGYSLSTSHFSEASLFVSFLSEHKCSALSDFLLGDLRKARAD
jgi:hypothetical protein